MRTNLIVLYPCATLARLGNPREVGQASATQLTLDSNQAIAVVEERMRASLAEIGVVRQPGAEGFRRRWYGVAPYLLDAAYEADGTLDDRLQEWHKHDGEGSPDQGNGRCSGRAQRGEATVHDGYTSPFWPFALARTSAGQEGLDSHTFSHAVVHWNLPSNPVDLEQREGRVHRYNGRAVRKNLASVHGSAAVTAAGTDPWQEMFAPPEAARPAGDSSINPYWVFPLEGGATIERYVPAMPLSREAKQYEQLQTTLGAYRFVMGQPRQEDLIRYLGADVERLRIDLGPPSCADQECNETPYGRASR